MGVADELTIEVATNGSVSPAESISLASQILRAHLTSLIEGIDSVPEVSVTLEAAPTSPSRSAISTSISELNLSVRSFNALKHRGIQTVQELAELTRSELGSVENLGKKSEREIIKALIAFGITLK
jgi:DNA-directed RNA polymerase subunit alpha